MRYVWQAVKAEGRRLQREVPLAILVRYYYRRGDDPAGMRAQGEIVESLLALVKRLPRRLGFVIRCYYGLQGKEPQTLQAIGDQLGLSLERVRQLREEALVWLRQPAHSQELRSLLARHNVRQYQLADELAQAWLKRRGGRDGRH
jgi:hypothetical protein